VDGWPETGLTKNDDGMEYGTVRDDDDDDDET